MSGSEDGQLRSPGEEIFSGDEHDTDSLDIKPPQAKVPQHSRDSTGARRKERSTTASSKEKKHSKERKHKERRTSGGAAGGSGREKIERDSSRGGGSAGSGGERRSDIERRSGEHRRDEEMPQQQQHQRYNQRGGGGGGAYEDRGDMMPNNERRYQKQHERGEIGGGGRGNHNYHHHQQQQQHHHHLPPPQHQQPYHHQQHQQQHHQMHHHHMPPRHCYDQRGPNFQHGGGVGGEYHHGAHGQHRHQSYGKHGGHVGHADYGSEDVEMLRGGGGERRSKYNYEPQKDAESLEQDLRSRLLSKRHKYVKGGGNEPPTEEPFGGGADRRNERSYEERERGAPAPNEREGRRKRDRGVAGEKLKVSVIEVFDSPDIQMEHQRRNSSGKHKRRNKERNAVDMSTASATSTEEVGRSKDEQTHRPTTPDDPELRARRTKLLAAEREKEKRKESAREELAARREMRRERGEIIDALSPSAVAASVTAGLGVVKRKKCKEDLGRVEAKPRKKTRKSNAASDEDDEAMEVYDDDDEDDEDTSETEEDDDSDEGAEEDADHSKESDSEEGAQSDAHEKKNYNTTTTTTKKRKPTKKQKSGGGGGSSDDDNVQLPESPLSIGELEKSPNHHKTTKRRKRHTQKKYADDAEEEMDVKKIDIRDDDDDNDENDDDESSQSHSEHSRSRSRSRSPRSRSRSRSSRSHSRSPISRSRSRSPRERRGRGRSSRSLTSRSRSPQSRSQSPRSHSRSRSRSEERHMKSNKRKVDAETIDAPPPAEMSKKTKTGGDDDDDASPARDDKGAPLPDYFPGIQGCRSVEEFQCLNRIEEGTYGVVYRAKDKRTNEIVALKRLKMEKEKEGFPITSLREINTLLKGQHPNIVTVREIVVGSNMDKIFIVMDYVEHDLKSLMETMKTRKQSFFPGEVKCLVQQLLRAVGHLHDNWILHRDLKTSNLLLSHKGILKVGDFGLAREYGSPLKKYTSLVVTLWYRAPELLLCSPEYSTPIDIWSVGCIFAEFLQMAPMFPGKSEIDELNRIFKELGTPNEKIWPGYKELPAVKNLLSQNSQFTEYPVSQLRKRFTEKTSESGCALLQGLLTYDPKQRLNADAALKHAYFKELPLPIDPSMFPTWPAKSELGARKALASSPKPPSGGSQFKQLGRDDVIVGGGAGGKVVSGIITGNKKTATNTGFVLNAGIDQRQLAMGPGFSLKF